MITSTTQWIAVAGGVLIGLSGVTSIILGARIGAWRYSVYPGGKMGHVGIWPGVGAILLGLVISLLLPRFYAADRRGLVIFSAALTVILGHVGAVAGAMYVGTVGVALCYIAGIWQLIITLF